MRFVKFENAPTSRDYAVLNQLGFQKTEIVFIADFYDEKFLRILMSYRGGGINLL